MRGLEQMADEWTWLLGLLVLGIHSLTVFLCIQTEPPQQHLLLTYQRYASHRAQHQRKVLHRGAPSTTHPIASRAGQWMSDARAI
jgi:hypothetical protein